MCYVDWLLSLLARQDFFHAPPGRLQLLWLHTCTCVCLYWLVWGCVEQWRCHSTVLQQVTAQQCTKQAVMPPAGGNRQVAGHCPNCTAWLQLLAALCVALFLLQCWPVLYWWSAVALSRPCASSRCGFSIFLFGEHGMVVRGVATAAS